MRQHNRKITFLHNTLISSGKRVYLLKQSFKSYSWKHYFNGIILGKNYTDTKISMSIIRRGDLSLVPGSHTEKGENWLWQAVLWPPHKYMSPTGYMHAPLLSPHPHTDKSNGTSIEESRGKITSRFLDIRQVIGFKLEWEVNTNTTAWIIENMMATLKRKFLLWDSLDI